MPIFTAHFFFKYKKLSIFTAITKFVSGGTGVIYLFIYFNVVFIKHWLKVGFQ